MDRNYNKRKRRYVTKALNRMTCNDEGRPESRTKKRKRCHGNNVLVMHTNVSDHNGDNLDSSTVRVGNQSFLNMEQYVSVNKT